MANIEEDEFQDTETPTGYKPPAEKTISEIMNLDTEDESLQKYKQTLLKDASASDSVILFPQNPSRIIVARSTLMVEGRDEIEFELDASKCKENVIILKEGISYCVKIEFYIQREIVHGLKYVRNTYRKGIRVDKTGFMLGSYAPQKELQTFITPQEETPSGVLGRGTYTIKTALVDDDKNKHVKWAGVVEIKKDWK